MTDTKIIKLLSFPNAAELLALLTENAAYVKTECDGMSLHGVNILNRANGEHAQSARLVLKTLSDGSKVADLELTFG